MFTFHVIFFYGMTATTTSIEYSSWLLFSQISCTFMGIDCILLVMFLLCTLPLSVWILVLLLVSYLENNKTSPYTFH